MPKPVAVPVIYVLNWPGVSVGLWHSTISVSSRFVPTAVVMPVAASLPVSVEDELPPDVLLSPDPPVDVPVELPPQPLIAPVSSMTADNSIATVLFFMIVLLCLFVSICFPKLYGRKPIRME